MNTTDSTHAPAPVLEPPVIAPLPITDAGQLLRIVPLTDRTGLRIEGELDHTTLPALRRALASMTSGDGGFCVDLSGLVFIDTGCLRALVNAAAALHDGGGERVLTLRSVPPHVGRLLELTGWHHTPGLHLQTPAHPGCLGLTQLSHEATDLRGCTGVVPATTRAARSPISSRRSGTVMSASSDALDRSTS